MDMIDKEIQKRLDEANKKLFRVQELISEAKTSIYEVSVAKAEHEAQSKDGWISVQERTPAEDKRVVVRTFEGATYFLHPIGGKFPDNVKEWYELPE